MTALRTTPMSDRVEGARVAPEPGSPRSSLSQVAPIGSLDAGTVSELDLARGYSIRTSRGSEEIQVVAPSGQVCVRIALSDAGPIVEVDAARLHFRAEQSIELNAPDVRIAGGRIALESKGALALRGQTGIELSTSEHLRMTAVSHHVHATTGDIHLDANDDVRIDGERIRLNAPEAPPLRKRGSELVLPQTGEDRAERGAE